LTVAWDSTKIVRAYSTGGPRPEAREGEGPAMKLRDHPLMKRKTGFQTWPPMWTTTHHDKDGKPIGEVGFLEDVTMSYLIDDKFFLFMKHEGLRYMGFMSFDDVKICSELYLLLKSKVGVSIKEIGDLDLDFAFWISSSPF
jgi:hypothetical protein